MDATSKRLKRKNDGETLKDVVVKKNKVDDDETVPKDANNKIQRIKKTKTVKNNKDDKPENPTDPEKEIENNVHSPQKSSSVFPPIFTTCGFLLSMGQGDTGQLGQGPDVMEAGKPTKTSLTDNIIQVCAGGMHSLCLTDEGEVISFGCNDEATLGRDTPEEDDCFNPGKVEGLTSKIIQVVAGDSHSAALNHLGQVFTWGTFRDSNGVIGMKDPKMKDDVVLEDVMTSQRTSVSAKVVKPTMVMSDVKIVKIASGTSHILCLSEDGCVYSFGSCDVGQLGRVSRFNCEKGGRRGVESLLTCGLVRIPKKKRCVNIWAGGYMSYAQISDGEVYVWGLNNYYQLGLNDMEVRLWPELSTSLSKGKLKDVVMAEHHVIVLNQDGVVSSFGRDTYGRLGHAQCDVVQEMTVIEKLKDVKVVSIGCGSAVSYAIDEDGVMYSWGMGSSLQLGNGDEEDDVLEPSPFAVKKLSSVKGVMASAGGQHTLMLVQRKTTEKEKKKDE